MNKTYGSVIDWGSAADGMHTQKGEPLFEADLRKDEYADLVEFIKITVHTPFTIKSHDYK